MVLKNLLERHFKSQLGCVLGQVGGFYVGYTDAKKTRSGFIWKPLSGVVVGGTLGIGLGYYWQYTLGALVVYDITKSLLPIIKN